MKEFRAAVILSAVARRNPVSSVAGAMQSVPVQKVKASTRARLFVLTLFISAGALCAASASAQRSRPTDLVVYGGTASGVMTAYTAARQGLHVVLLEPSHHLGGMVTGGLSATDHGDFHVIGGYTREFYRQAAATYGVHSLDKASDWLSEPKVGEAIFDRWLKDAGVDVRLGERLKEHGGVIKKGTRLIALVTEDGRRWPAKVFADCSYEGDVMAESHVRYVVGRESTAEFGESLAGIRTHTPKHQFLWKVDAYDAHHHLLPEINPGPLRPAGAGDHRVQAYNFRLILTDDPANKMPWTRPVGYKRADFALFAKYLQSYKQHAGKDPVFKTVTNPVCFAHHKCDFNNNGPFSTDFIGKSWGYPDGTYSERRYIWAAHLLYTKSFFYFLATDPTVPQSLRDDTNRWGRAKDEFRDTDGWPRQLYIREGRRMRGVYVIRQSDLQTQRTKPDAIAMGSYNSDSHNVERVALADGAAFNEGDVQVPVKPYEIPYRAILPKPSQTTNLLVPVCLSATHVAYSSVRMEPQYMMIGEAAGTAAYLAVKSNTAVQDISTGQLQLLLRTHGAILHLKQQIGAQLARTP